MPWGAIAGAAATVAGGIYSDRQSTKDHKRQLAHNAYWNSNKYQHTVRDLKAAGLNPALAYRQGASAQTSASAPSRENIGAKAATAAKEVALLTSQKKNLDAQTNLYDAQAQSEAQNVPLRQSGTRLNEQKILESSALTNYAKEQARKLAFNNNQLDYVNNATGLNLSSLDLLDLIITEGSPLYGIGKRIHTEGPKGYGINAPQVWLGKALSKAILTNIDGVKEFLRAGAAKGSNWYPLKNFGSPSRN